MLHGPDEAGFELFGIDGVLILVSVVAAASASSSASGSSASSAGPAPGPRRVAHRAPAARPASSTGARFNKW